MSLPLPSIDTNKDSALKPLLNRRTSIRDYSNLPLNLAQLSQLLWAGQGQITNNHKRTTASAAGQYPIQLFVAAKNVAGLDRGLYEYQIADHILEHCFSADLHPELEKLAIGDQPWIGNSAAILIITADIEKMNTRFAEQPPVGQRGERYAYIETGCITQNIQLQTTETKLGSVFVGGYDNSATKALFKLTDNLEVTGLICIGQPA
ncbi:MAG: SagB-type dehydrogenase family enzyme [Gammaproteobacteria bacterium]|jgi:SagB-type dehydrogenase family enzyme